MFSLVFQCTAASHQAWLVASMGFLGHNLRLQLSAEGFRTETVGECEIVRLFFLTRVSSTAHGCI